MSIANLSVSSFASGVELKAALKKQNFELLLMDYHLALNGFKFYGNRVLLDPVPALYFLPLTALPKPLVGSWIYNQTYY